MRHNTSSELICTGSNSEPATSVGQSVPDWHGHVLTGPERVVQQHSGLAVVGRRLTTEVLQVVSYSSPVYWGSQPQLPVGDLSRLMWRDAWVV